MTHHCTTCVSTWCGQVHFVMLCSVPVTMFLKESHFSQRLRGAARPVSKTLGIRRPGLSRRDAVSPGMSSGYISRKYCQGMQHWDLVLGCIIRVCPQGVRCHTATCPQVHSQPDPQACCCRTLQFMSHHSNKQGVMLWHRISFTQMSALTSVMMLYSER